VLVLLNVADSQSVPLELASRMAERGSVDVHIAAFMKRRSDFPAATFGPPITELRARRNWSPVAIWGLWRLIRRIRPDIVHVHLWPSGIWGTLLGRLAGAAVVKTEHNDVRFQSAQKRIVNVAMYPFTRMLICNSQATLDSLGPAERRGIARRAEVIHNGVDFTGIDSASRDSAAVRRELGIDDGVLIGAVGRMVPQKNLVRLIQGFSRAMADPRASNAWLLLVGDGNLKGELLAEASKAGIGERVIFTGGVSRNRVYELLFAMDILVVPSLWEGFCNAAVEAAGAGRAISAADITVLREVLGDHAVYFDPSDPEAIAQCLAMMAAEDETTRRVRGELARAWARSRYDIDVAAKRYEELFVRITQTGMVSRPAR
jgi:glycosyltransferase involved in cell wall biosynthesis